mgnify:CR=1 FL=1
MRSVWLAMVTTVATMTTWLAAQLYLYDGIASYESDLCIWTSLSRQLLDFGLAPGDLVTYYNRSILDLIIALPVVAVFGPGTKVAVLSFAISF